MSLATGSMRLLSQLRTSTFEDFETEPLDDQRDLLDNVTTPSPSFSPSISSDSPTVPPDGLSESVIWGIVGFSLFGLAIVVAFFGVYSARRGADDNMFSGIFSRPNSPLNNNNLNNSNESGKAISAAEMDSPQSPLTFAHRPPLVSFSKGSQPPRESMSTVMSRDRFSTISGRFSGKFEAAEGKDDGLMGYVHDKRHVRNEKKRARGLFSRRSKQKEVEMARNGTMNSKKFTATEASLKMMDAEADMMPSLNSQIQMQASIGSNPNSNARRQATFETDIETEGENGFDSPDGGNNI